MKKKKKNRKKQQGLTIGLKLSNRLKMMSNPSIGLHVSQDDTAVNTDFCLQIANRVCMEKLSEGLNCACSPVSIHTCLSLVAAGSTGKTLDQLLFYLKSAIIDDLNGQSSRMVQLMSPLSNGGPVLSFAHSLWVDKHRLLKRAFQEIAFGAYGADVKNVDLERKAKATRAINSWVESRTNGLIKQIINPDFITDETVLILANALYFKGNWARQFDTSSTYNRKYHLLNGRTIQVPFMHESNKHPFRAFGTYKVLKLPYQNGLENTIFSMYIFLPEKKNGLKNLIKEFSSNVGFLTQDFKLEEVDLEVVAIPRFKISYKFDPSEMVMELGLLLPFMATGDISNMVDSGKQLFVAKIDSP